MCVTVTKSAGGWIHKIHILHKKIKLVLLKPALDVKGGNAVGCGHFGNDGECAVSLIC